MQGLLNDQYRKNNILDMTDIAISLLIFSAPILNCILYITKRSATSGQLAIVYIVVAILSAITAFRSSHRKISVNLFKCSIVLLLILFGFLATKEIYGYSNATFDSELKLYIATIPSIILIAYVVEFKQKSYISLPLIAFVDVLLTIICTLVVISGNGTTSAGLLSDTSGFLYQNTSYFAAYTIGMNVFLISETSLRNKGKLIPVLLFLLTLEQFVICVAAGGRGGVVLAVILIISGIIMLKGAKTAFFWIAIAGIVLLFILRFIPQLLLRFGIDLTGMLRIFESVSTGSDTLRNSIWSESFAEFINRPILGSGIGSVFYLFGRYSHNFVLDILCETGIVGFAIVFAIIYGFIKKIKTIYYSGPLYRFLLMTFVCGITMNLFSGYVWVNQQVLLPIIIVYCADYKCGDEEE